MDDNRVYGGQWIRRALQKTCYEAVLDIYRRIKNFDHALLAQASLLLSYWSPPCDEPQHNSEFWIGKAFQHALKAGLHQPTSEALTDRSRIIVCSILVRDRFLAF